MFQVIVEVLMVLVVLIVGVTQVFIPLVDGTKLFPLLRRKDLEDDLIEVNEEIDLEEMRRKVQEKFEELMKLRKIRMDERAKWDTKDKKENDQNG